MPSTTEWRRDLALVERFGCRPSRKVRELQKEWSKLFGARDGRLGFSIEL